MHVPLQLKDSTKPSTFLSFRVAPHSFADSLEPRANTSRHAHAQCALAQTPCCQFVKDPTNSSRNNLY